MNFAKQLLLSIAATAYLTMLFCSNPTDSGSNNNPVTANDIVGSWIVDSVVDRGWIEYPNEEKKDTVFLGEDIQKGEDTLTFKNDGTLISTHLDGTKIFGTWTLSESTLTLTSAEESYPYQITINGAMFTLTQTVPTEYTDDAGIKGNIVVVERTCMHKL